MVRRLFPVLVVGLAAALVGCGGDRADALDGLEKMKAACSENDKDLARTIAENLRKSNKVFEKAFSAAVEEKGGSINYCSPLLHNEVTLRIEHGG